MDWTQTKSLLLRARGLAALREVLNDEAGGLFLRLLGVLSEQRPEPGTAADAFGRLWGKLALEDDRLLPDAWRSHLVGRILGTETPFALAAERGMVGAALLEQTRRDLSTLKGLFDLDAPALIRAVEDRHGELAGVWTPWTYPEPDPEPPSPRRALAGEFAGTRDWGGMAEALADFHAVHGAGDFSRYTAFRWEGGALRPVAEPDGVRLADLVGYEGERQPLVRNTERLLAGLPAQHALLYGPPGTGKSSTVKAVANEYAGRGLRLVEVAKEDLNELPQVLKLLRGRSPRFVVFVDDLSFEEGEVSYKALKALLEGSVEEPPFNARLYATSNRRNLIRESFAERDGEVHARDTEREKQSLVARFGLRLTFPAPDQARYLQIVTGLARERGLRVPDEVLRERALLWDRWHAGRSGRTARQLVDELEAEMVGKTP